MRLKPVELFLALGLAATTVACGQKETPNPTGGATPQGTVTTPTGQAAPAAKQDGDKGDKKSDKDKNHEGGEGGEGGEGT
jgi:hypothetical protein